MRLFKTDNDRSINTDLDRLRQAADARSDNVQAQFQYAGALDSLGREAEALPVYERVLKDIDRLPTDDQSRLFVQLGSTLRNLNELKRSRAVLMEGLRRFPNNAALSAFLALTEHSSRNYRESTTLLMNVILSSSSDVSISNYSKALQWYSENLNAASQPTRSAYRSAMVIKALLG